MAVTTPLTDPWTARRRRVVTLRERYPFARDFLDLYAALLDVQAPAFAFAQASAPPVGDLARYAAQRVLPAVATATYAYGPKALAHLVRQRLDAADATEIIRSWLHETEQAPVDRYLARASLGPVLEALGPRAGNSSPRARHAHQCPACGGRPQVSYSAPSAESLVTPRRYLTCARCSANWPYPRMTCVHCGEHQASQLTIFAETGATDGEGRGRIVRGVDGVLSDEPAASTLRFPHMRIEACATCSHYLIGVDLTRDPLAVPIVDEMVAAPLAMYAADQGLLKVIPNLMGV